MSNQQRVSCRQPHAPQPHPPVRAASGGSSAAVVQLAALQRTIGNQQVLRLLAGRTGAPQTRRSVVVQRYTEEDIRARAHKIYVLRTQGARPGGHTDANVQAGEKADWTQARRELDGIERRAREISQERSDHPDRFPSAAGPMSDWLTAEQEFDTQTSQPPTSTSQPATSTNQPGSLSLRSRPRFSCHVPASHALRRWNRDRP